MNAESKLPSLRKQGILNLTIHLPVFMLTSFWGLMLVGLFDLSTLDTPFWSAVSLAPLVLSPLSCVIGIVRGARRIKKERHAITCLVCSILGIVLFAGMLFGAAWLGSIA